MNSKVSGHACKIGGVTSYNLQTKPIPKPRVSDSSEGGWYSNPRAPVEDRDAMEFES